MTLEGAIPKLQVKICGWKIFSSKGAIAKLQLKNLWVKSIQFRRRHPKTAGEKSRHKVPSQNCRWKFLRSQGSIPKLEAKHRIPSNATGRHWFQKVQNPDPNKLHNAFKSCSRQQTPTKKAEEPNSAKTHKWSMWFCCLCFNVQMHNFGTWTLRAIAQMNYSIKTDAKKITSKPNTDNPQCHWLPASFSNGSKSRSQETSQRVQVMFEAKKNLQKAWSRNWTVRRWVRKLTKMNCMDGSMMDEL